MLTLPAIAFQIFVPPVVWRADSGFRHDAGTSAADVVRYERDELGNALGITAALISELENYPAASLAWVTFKRHDAARYGKPERVKIDCQAYVIAEDGDGGFLILFCDHPAPLQTEGYTMSKPADDIKADAQTQAEAAAKHEQERDLAASKGEALPGDPATAPAQAIAPEDEKKKGGADSSPGITPLVPDLSLNIRPDIVTGPGGDQIVTTMKNSTIDRDAAEALADMDKANALEDAFQNEIMTRYKIDDFAKFEHYEAGGFFDQDRERFEAAYAADTPQEPAPTPGERDASPEAVLDQQNAASAKEQEAELAASAGAATQEADDKSGMTYSERLQARAEESRQRHAAEADAAPERDAQEFSTGRD